MDLKVQRSNHSPNCCPDCTLKPNTHGRLRSDSNDGFELASNKTKFEKLSSSRFDFAKQICNEKKQGEGFNVFYSKARTAIINRLNSPFDKHNLRDQNRKKRLERRLKNLEFLNRQIKQQKLTFHGAMGWGEFCKFRTHLGDGSSELDSIYFSYPNGDLKCIQLDSCLEAQCNCWCPTVDYESDSDNNDLSFHGQLLFADWSNISDKNEIKCLLKGKEFLLNTFSTFNIHAQPTFVASASSNSGLDSFETIFRELRKKVAKTQMRVFEKVEEKLFPKTAKHHKNKVRKTFQTYTNVFRNGFMWTMPGNGSAVLLGKDLTPTGLAIDQWVDNSLKPDYVTEERDDSGSEFVQKHVIPLNQVAHHSTDRIMLYMVLINAIAGYPIAKYDDSIHITPKDAQKLFDVLQTKDEANPGLKQYKRCYYHQWIKDAGFKGDAAKDIVKKLLKQVKSFSVFADHIGICCPSCQKDDQSCSTKTRTHSVVVKRPGAPVHQPINLNLKVNEEAHLSPSVVIEEIKKPINSLSQKLEGLDDFEAHLEEYKNQLGLYRVNDAFKTAMMIKYLMSFLDTIDQYIKRQSTPQESTSLDDLIRIEIDALKIILYRLVRGLVTEPNIPGGVNNDNWHTKDIVATNYKARFSIAALVTKAFKLLKLTEENPIVIEANETIFSKVKFNGAITDEATFLRKYRRVNQDPKVDELNVRVPLGERLLGQLRPIPLNMVAGKLGAGKSCYVSHSFDQEKQKINDKRVFRLDNIEKESSSFDVKTSDPRKRVLITLTEPAVLDLENKFKKLKVSEDKDNADDPDATKLVGCACCSGRGLTQSAIEAVDTGNKGLDSEAVVLDTIGYADFKGIATISHEAIMGRVFFNHAITLVNLNNPDWHEVYKQFLKFKNEPSTTNTIIDRLDQAFEGTFKNVLVQQLVHATHVLINNHGKTAEGKITTKENLKSMVEEISGQDVIVVENFNAKNPNDQKNLLSSFSETQATRLAPELIPQEVDIFESELDASFKQVDYDISELSDEEVLRFIDEIKRLGENGQIDRAKGYYQVNGGRWIEFQITDGRNYYDTNSPR